MKLNEINDPLQFYKFLLKKYNNYPRKSAFIQGLAYSLYQDPHQYEHKPLLATVEENGEERITIFMTPPWPIILYSEHDVTENEVEFICDYLIKKKLKVNGVNAEAHLSEIFSDLWCKKNNCVKEKNIEMILYYLEKTKPINHSNGYLKIADISNRHLLIDWSIKFNRDLRLNMEKSYIEHHVDFVIRNNQAFVWIDNETPVSMVFYERPFTQGVFIGYVYTPAEQRKKGYATNCVYHASNHCLKSKFSFCSLFTDKENSTTNDIYQQIGYKPCAEYLYYNFTY